MSKRYFLIPLIVILGIVCIYACRNNEIKYVPPVEVERGVSDWKTAVEKSEQIKERNEQSEIKKTMENQIWVNILTFLGILAAIWLNPKLLKLEKGQIELKDEIKHLKTPETLESALRKMAANRLESCRPLLRNFINMESERLINVANEIMRSSFNYDGLSQAIIKIELAEAQSITDSCSLGADFCQLYRVHVSNVVKHLKDDVSDILLDEKYNSKHSRFALSCQVFWRDHSKGIIDIYEQVAK